MQSNNEVFLASAKLKVNGVDSECNVYADGTAILENGRKITLKPETMAIIKKRIEEAKIEAQRVMYETQALGQNISGDDKYYDDDALERYAKGASFSLPRTIVATVLYLAVFVVTIFGANYLLDNYQSRVHVAQISNAIAKDAELTSTFVKPLEMSESNFRRLAETSAGNIIMWNEIEKYFGQYMTFDVMEGQYLTDQYLSKNRVMRNPWITTLELYTTPFDADAVYSQFITPGSHLKMLAIVTEYDENGKMHTTEYGNRTGFVSSNNADAKSKAEAPIKEIATESEGEAQDENDADTNADAETSGDTKILDSNEVQVAQERGYGESVKHALEKVPDLYGDITVVDLINGDGESVFNHYLTLSRMTVAQRRAFFEEKAASANASRYVSKFRGASIVFAFKEEQVSNMAKIEKMENVSFKYTVLPSSSTEYTDEQMSLLLIFTEIQNEISEVFGNIETVVTK